MKNIEIVNQIRVLENFLDTRLPQKISYAISRNYKYLNEEYKTYQESLNKLFKAYDEFMEKDEDGRVKTDNYGIPIVGADKDGDFREELSELLSIDVDVKRYEIDPELFDYDDSGKYQSLTVKDMNALMDIMCKG